VFEFGISTPFHIAIMDYREKANIFSMVDADHSKFLMEVILDYL
jgi:hypothetical protein